MKWISIKKELPFHLTSVLTFDGKYIQILDDWYELNGKILFTSHSKPGKCEIKYWLPLPNPPDENEMD